MRWVTVRSRCARTSERRVVHRRRRGLAAVLVAVALLSTSVGSIEASGSPPQAAADPKVVSDWNAVAFDTIIVDARKMNAEAFMWFAFEQAAVYNAVVGITRRYELQLGRPRAARSVTAGRRRGRHARCAARVLPGVAGPVGHRAGGVARRCSRW